MTMKYKGETFEANWFINRQSGRRRFRVSITEHYEIQNKDWAITWLTDRGLPKNKAEKLLP